jgi:hypothetical protein
MLPQITLNRVADLYVVINDQNNRTGHESLLKLWLLGQENNASIVFLTDL